MFGSHAVKGGKRTNRRYSPFAFDAHFMKLERREAPVFLSFYQNPAYPAGIFSAYASAFVASIDPAASTSSTVTTVAPGSLSVTTSKTNIVYGTLPTMSSGGPVPGVTRVRATELSGVSSTFHEMGVNVDAPGATVKWGADHYVTSIVETDQRGPYSVGLYQANGASSIRTSTPFKYDVKNMPSGSGPTSTSTLVVTLGVTVSPPPSGFDFKAGLSFQSSRLNISINIHGAGGPAPGLLAWDPLTGTVYASDPNYTGVNPPGTPPMSFVVPTSATETFYVGSMLASFPDGMFNAASTSGTAEMEYLLTATVHP